MVAQSQIRLQSQRPGRCQRSCPCPEARPDGEGASGPRWQFWACLGSSPQIPGPWRTRWGPAFGQVDAMSHHRQGSVLWTASVPHPMHTLRPFREPLQPTPLLHAHSSAGLSPLLTGAQSLRPRARLAPGLLDLWSWILLRAYPFIHSTNIS